MPSNEDLPEEIILQIQLRLPVKSLMRFCCVSKNWLSTISDHKFRKSHFKLASQQQTLSPRFLRYTSEPQFESIELETPSFGDRHVIRNLTFPIRKTLNDWCFALGSCNGLVCLLYSGLYVWNPTTDCVRSIPFPSYDDDVQDVVIYNCGIGHVSATDDYKIVMISDIQKIYTPNPRVRPYSERTSVIEIFSLRANSWKSKEAPMFQMVYPLRRGVFSNEALHWLEWFDHSRRRAVLAFDLVKEEFREIALPIEMADKMREMTVGVVLGGCLCLTTFCDHEFFQCWVMREYNVHNSWTALYKFYVGIHPGLRRPIFVSESCIIFKEGQFSLTKFDHQEEKPDDEIAVCTGQYFTGREFDIILYDESLLPLNDLMP